MLRNISVIMENIENTNLVDDMECPICYDFMGGQIVVCQEGHSICQECYREMQKIKKCFCPICYGQILTRRNITLEKVSSKIKTLLEIKNNAVISREMSNKNYVEKEDFNCPEECGFCTDRLINLRVHLNQLHPTQITRIKCESTKECKSRKHRGGSCGTISKGKSKEEKDVTEDPKIWET
ncbi:hypothetical protein ABEB36_007290 [Hypothenemus hampei]|uniref:RING-type domain-containing protein n=1 Tax=Hypothenemus hampei TaxID=57062 RepID=A0ABD1ETI5_HYPHA